MLLLFIIRNRILSTFVTVFLITLPLFCKRKHIITTIIIIIYDELFMIILRKALMYLFLQNSLKFVLKFNLWSSKWTMYLNIIYLKMHCIVKYILKHLFLITLLKSQILWNCNSMLNFLFHFELNTSLIHTIIRPVKSAH